MPFAPSRGGSRSDRPEARRRPRRLARERERELQRVAREEADRAGGGEVGAGEVERGPLDLDCRDRSRALGERAGEVACAAVELEHVQPVRREEVEGCAHEQRVRAAVRLLEDVGAGALQPGRGDAGHARVAEHRVADHSRRAALRLEHGPAERRHRGEERRDARADRGVDAGRSSHAAPRPSCPDHSSATLARREPDLGERRPDGAPEGVEPLLEQVALAEPHRRVRAAAEVHEPAARAIEVELRARPVPQRRRRAQDRARLVRAGLEARDAPERLADGPVLRGELRRVADVQPLAAAHS